MTYLLCCEGIERTLRECIWGYRACLKVRRGNASRALLKVHLRVFEDAWSHVWRCTGGMPLRTLKALLNVRLRVRWRCVEKVFEGSLRACLRAHWGCIKGTSKGCIWGCWGTRSKACLRHIWGCRWLVATDFNRSVVVGWRSGPLGETGQLVKVWLRPKWAKNQTRPDLETLLIVGSGHTCNKDMGSEGNTLGECWQWGCKCVQLRGGWGGATMQCWAKAELYNVE